MAGFRMFDGVERAKIEEALAQLVARYA